MPFLQIFAFIGAMAIGAILHSQILGTLFWAAETASATRVSVREPAAPAPSAPSQAGYYEEAPRPRLRQTSFDDLPSDLPPGQCQDPDTGVVYRC